jgi:hypothetical protein
VAEGYLRALGKYKWPKAVIIEGEKITVTPEMKDAVKTYGDYVLSQPGSLSIETKIIVYHDTEPLHGTADAYRVAGATAEVVDFKYGAGYYVDAGSPQFRIYGLGVLDDIGPFTQIDNVLLTVIQPRADLENPIRTVSVPVAELRQWEKDTLRPALDRVARGDAQELPGSHCKWCVRAGECKALAQLAMSKAQVAFGDVPPEPSGMTNEELGAVLEHGEMIVDWLGKVRAEVSQRIDTGQTVPGWKLVAKRAMRKWINGSDALAALIQRHVPILDIVRIETIGNVEKALKVHKLPMTLIEDLTVKESSGSTLASEKDGRPALDTDVQNVFN